MMQISSLFTPISHLPSSHLPPRRGMGYTNIFRRCDGGSPQATRYYWLLAVGFAELWLRLLKNRK
jgi:hypothetical protein